MRLFIAINIPEYIRNYVDEIRQELAKVKGDVKWVEPHNYHFTVKFLGETEPRLLPSIESALALAAESGIGFDISLQGLGFFPNHRRPRVLWAGVRGETEPMFFLGDRVDTYLTACGFTTEDKRTFHLTLGRIRSERNLPDLIKATANLSSALNTVPFRVDRFCLMESRLSPAGPVYVEKKVFYLQ